MVFFKSFIDEDKHFYSATKDQNTGEFVVSSNGIRTSNNPPNKIKEGEVGQIRGRVSSTTAKAEVGQILASITTKSVRNSNDNSRSLNMSISKLKQKIQDDTNSYAREMAMMRLESTIYLRIKLQKVFSEKRS